MQLKPHQQKVIDTAPNKWALFFDCGLGKTATALSLVDTRLSGGKVLVITTKSLKDNWKCEIDLWIKDKGKNVFYVYSKEEFKKVYKTLPKMDCVVIDEAHTASGYKSQIHKACVSFISVHKPEHIYLATATPIMSEVWSVWALSRLLGKECMPFWSFRRKFFTEVKMGNKVIPMQRKNIEGEITELLRSFGSVVSTEDVLGPTDVVHETEYFMQTKEQDRAVMLLDEDPTTINHMTYFTKCLQIASGTLKTDENGGYEEIKCSKLDRVKELIEQMSGSKSLHCEQSKQYPNICIVAKHTAELRMLHNNIPNSYVYDGHTPKEERQKIIDDINKQGGVLLLQADCGIGFNLTSINLMVFYSHTFDYIKYSQCLGRNGGFRQKGRNVYLHLVTKGTIDENVLRCLERKESFDISLYSRRTT